MDPNHSLPETLLTTDPWLFIARFESATRYYVLRGDTDLFGNRVLSRFWGSKHSHRGGQKHETVSSREAGLQRLAKLTRTRILHGYQDCAG